MPALLVFVVFLIAIAVSIPIGVSMILGSIAPIFLMGKGGSVVQLLNNTFSGANSTPIWPYRFSFWAALSWQRVEFPKNCLTFSLILPEECRVDFPVR